MFYAESHGETTLLVFKAKMCEIKIHVNVVKTTLCDKNKALMLTMKSSTLKNKTKHFQT